LIPISFIPREKKDIPIIRFIKGEMQNAKCKMQSAKCKVRNVKMQNAKCKMQNEKSKRE
jgi:hypothetical protein